MVYPMQQLFRRAYVGLFVLFLFTPILASYHLEPNHPCRPDTLLMAGDRRASLRAFRDLFERQFVIGPELQTARMRWMYRLFGISAAPEVLAGHRDWLYLYGGVYANKRSIAREPFEAKELQAWVDNIASWRAYLDRKDIHLAFMIAPDKHSIYPEYLPWHLQQRRGGTSRIDTLIEALRADSRTHDLHIVDPRPELLRHKGDAELFYRADTHWNNLGALAAYQALVQQMQPWYPQIQAFEFKDFAQHCQESSKGDLASILNLTKSDLFRRCEIVWPESFEREHSHPLVNQLAWYGTDVNVHLPPRPIRNLLVWGDSFSTGFLPFILAHTTEARVLRGAGLYDADELNLQQPDLVIIEMVERHLYGDAPRPPGAPRGYVFAEGFFQELVDRRPDERWMTHDAALRLSAEQVKNHAGIKISLRIPAAAAASGPIMYGLNDQPLRPVPQKDLEGYVVIASHDWPVGTQDYTIRLHGEGAMVPALTCGNMSDHRELTASVKVDWVN